MRLKSSYIIVILLIIFLSACNTRKDNPLLNEPVRDRTGDPVRFQITTTTYYGNYSPKNVGAIWIENDGNEFIKTLRVWGKNRRKHLVVWNEISNGNTVDAVTGATKKSHGLLEATWNLLDVNEVPHDSGKYFINVEFTEDNSKDNGKLGKTFRGGFTLPDSVISINFEDQSYFQNAKLIIESF